MNFIPITMDFILKMMAFLCLQVGVTEAELEERRACQREISARIAAMRSAIMG